MKSSIKTSTALLLTVLFFSAVLAMAPTAQARSITPVEGAKFDTAGSMNDNLKSLMDKDVVIHVRSGKTFQGRVKAIGDHLIHLEKLSGRDFFDALIRLEDVTAIEIKFRELK